ncbi:MAG: hypothetical protein JNK75_11375 [Betaproteobacteria bacterium]|nr:hypothetical protein [Betaproteobacteria bacterium]
MTGAAFSIGVVAVHAAKILTFACASRMARLPAMVARLTLALPLSHRNSHMNTSRLSPLSFRPLALATLLALLLPAHAQRYGGGAAQAAPEVKEQKAEQQGLREEVGKPLLAAEALVKEKKFDEAMAKIDDAEKVANRTEYENYFILRLRATTALSSGKDALAVQSLMKAYAMPQMPAADKGKIADAITRINYKLKDYKTAATWAATALKEGGGSDLRLIQGHALYLTEDYPAAQREIAEFLSESEKSGKTPPEEQYRLLAGIATKLKDDAGYVAVLEKLVVSYPKREYWNDLIVRTEVKKGFSDRLVLDMYRLKLELGLLTSTGDFLEMANYVLNQLGYPAEAKKVIDAGIDAGALSKDSTNDKYRKLMAAINKELAEEKARAAKNTPIPNTSVARLNNGYDLVIKGETQRGLDMMAEGLKLPDLKRPEEARLRYGIAHVLAGQKDKASEIFRTINGPDGLTEAARLWDFYARKKS